MATLEQAVLVTSPDSLEQLDAVLTLEMAYLRANRRSAARELAQRHQIAQRSYRPLEGRFSSEELSDERSWINHTPPASADQFRAETSGLRKRRDAIGSCYSDAARREQGLSGDAVFTLWAQPDGTVARVTFRGRGFNRAVVDCFLRAAASLPFEPSQHGELVHWSAKFGARGGS
ncbi:MAG: hypothetical protein QM756_02035 [Polyangiaceae bacterium]